MKKIYLHVGMAKTGTTALQAFFYANRERLKNSGCIYPLEYGGEAKGKYLFNDGNIGKLYADSSISDEEKATKIIELVNKYGSILLSTERIWLQTALKKNANFLKVLKSKCGEEVEIILICYLRRQIDYLESQYKQAIKETKVTKNIWEFCESEQISRQMNSKYVLSLFEEVLGSENIVVRVYEKQQFVGGSIFTDFIDAMGITGDEPYHRPSNLANISLDNTTVELKKMINRVEYPEQTINDTFYHWMAEATAVKKNEIDKVNHFETSISLADKKKFMEEYEEINKYVAQRYFQRDILFMEPYSEPKEEVSDREVIEELVFVFASSIIGMDSRLRLLENEKKTQLKEHVEKEDDIVKKLLEEREQLKIKLEEKQRELEAMRNGYSWKITAPLRKVRRIILKEK